MPTTDTASSVKPHTEAKLQFYSKYLERYLGILLRASSVSKINIYDMFCGEGIYSDGNTGSAVRAVEAIWKAGMSRSKSKPINLHLNDLNSAKVDKLENLLASRQSEEKEFRISFSSVEAFELLNRLTERFKVQSNTVRNLIFIDPYGYSAIKKDTLEHVLDDRKTEAILFLPIEQMYRFRNLTNEDVVENSYQPLKDFIDQFGLVVSEINSEKEFIQSVASALTFSGQFYATSYAIKNHTGHYYGMFFITPNLKGLEKIIDVKWHLDTQQGEESGVVQNDFFLEVDKKSSLELKLKDLLSKTDQTNKQLYEFVLKLGFLPKHANDIFRDWQNKSWLTVKDLATGKPARRGTFKLTYRDSQSRSPALEYSLVEIKT